MACWAVISSLVETVTISSHRLVGGQRERAFDVLDTLTISCLAEAYRQQILAEDDEARYGPPDMDFFLHVRQQLDVEGVGIKAVAFDDDPVGHWSYKQAETITVFRATCLHMRKRVDVADR